MVSLMRRRGNRQGHRCRRGRVTHVAGRAGRCGLQAHRRDRGLMVYKGTVIPWPHQVTLVHKDTVIPWSDQGTVIFKGAVIRWSHQGAGQSYSRSRSWKRSSLPVALTLTSTVFVCYVFILCFLLCAFLVNVCFVCFVLVLSHCCRLVSLLLSCLIGVVLSCLIAVVLSCLIDVCFVSLMFVLSH